MGDFSDLRHLWDGSEPGWRLVRVVSRNWTVKARFSDTGPSTKEISAVRRLSPRFQTLTSAEVRHAVSGRESVDLGERMATDVEAQSLALAAKEAGLAVEVFSEELVGLLPISPNGGAVVIEDDIVAREVKERMIAAGVPVIDAHELPRRRDS